MNNQPSYTGEADEEYFSSDDFEQGTAEAQSSGMQSSEAYSSHADALHADALGRDITPRDIARTEVDSSGAYFAEADYSASPYAAPYSQESPYAGVSQTSKSDNGQAEEDVLYNSHLLINSSYFNIANRLDDSVAGLVVLMDNSGQAVRSELNLYEDISEAEKQEAIRQANLLIKEQFSSPQGQPESQMLELRIFDTKQKYATLYVDLPYRTATSRSLTNDVRRWWPLAAAALAVLFGLFIFWWLLSNIMGTGDDLIQADNGAQGEASTALNTTNDAATFDPDKPILNVVTPNASIGQEETVQGEPPQTDPPQGDTVQGQPVESQTGTQNTQEIAVQPAWVDPSVEQTNQLKNSVNADPAINRSSRVRVLPGIQIMLRSHPGPAAGTPKGVMQDGQEAIVVGGSYWTEGERDTIVWWYVRLDDGTEAWIAANTSDLTLLEPVY